MYVPLFIPLALAVGFDTITGTAMVLVGASVGFTTAIMNPFTVGLAQGIAGLPMYSGDGVPPRFIRSHICNCCYIRLSSCYESKEGSCKRNLRKIRYK